MEAEKALRSLKMKMANKGKRPIRQTNTANQVKRSPNYNNANIFGNNNMNQRENYNNMNYNHYNDMNYNYSPNILEHGKKQNIYGGMKSNENRKPITANQYNRNHNYNNNMDMNIDNNYSNNKNRNFKANQYNVNKNNYNNYNNNYNNYNNNYKNNNIRRRNNNNYNIHNYNNIQDNENDERPIGGGLTADQMPQENSPTSPCPHS